MSSIRSFAFATKIDMNGRVVKAFPCARLPEYQTKFSAGADFFCAEAVVIPSIWKQIFAKLGSHFTGNDVDITPTLVHTGIKSNMEHDAYLELTNRSSNPKSFGLVLANGVGIVDRDYYSNDSNDGEIMFAFYNFKFKDVYVAVGQRIGQGIFHKYLRPLDEADGLRVKDKIRTLGFGSTGYASDVKDGESDESTTS